MPCSQKSVRTSEEAAMPMSFFTEYFEYLDGQKNQI